LGACIVAGTAQRGGEPEIIDDDPGQSARSIFGPNLVPGTLLISLDSPPRIRILSRWSRVTGEMDNMCERQLTVQFVCDRLEERDAVIAALRPLVAEGWRVDALYCFGNRPQRYRMILGERKDVFEAA